MTAAAARGGAAGVASRNVIDTSGKKPCLPGALEVRRGVEEQPVGARLQLRRGETGAPAVVVGLTGTDHGADVGVEAGQAHRHAGGGSAARRVEHVGGDGGSAHAAVSSTSRPSRIRLIRPSSRRTTARSVTGSLREPPLQHREQLLGAAPGGAHEVDLAELGLVRRFPSANACSVLASAPLTPGLLTSRPRPALTLGTLTDARVPRQRTGHVVLVEVGEGVVGRGEQLLRRGVGAPGGDRGRPPRRGAAGGEHALGLRRGQRVEDGQAEALGGRRRPAAISCPAARTGACGRWRSGWPRRPGRRTGGWRSWRPRSAPRRAPALGEFSIRCQPVRRMESRVLDVAHAHDQRDAELPR